MSTATDIDLELLVGEMEAVECESPGHGNEHSHGGEATHYARVSCPSCALSFVKAYCGPFVGYLAAGGALMCGACGAYFSASEYATILGPVNK